MPPIQIGAIEVSICIERPSLALPLDMVVPNADPDWLGLQRSWLEPRYANLALGTVNLSFHSFVIRSAGRTILVDACIGNDKEREGVDFFHRQSSDYLGALGGLGLAPEDVDVVLCTHLHADHVGWNTRLSSGAWVPTFPRARYVFAEQEYRHWEREYQSDRNVNQGSFADSVLPVVRTGQADLVACDYELARGLVLEAAPGHTPGNVVLRAASRGQTGLFSGDVVHHPIQVCRPEWPSGFCLDPVASATTRRVILETVVESDTLVFPAHFCAPTAGRVLSATGTNSFGWQWLSNPAVQGIEK